jgi:hypothetical protein
MRRGSDVQRSIARIHVVMNRGVVVCVRILATGTRSKSTGCEIGCRVQVLPCLEVIMRSNRSEQGKQGTVVGSFDLPI